LNTKKDRPNHEYELSERADHPEGSVFVIGDLHLNHGTIISRCNRPFENTAEMNRVLINNWNLTIGKSDYVFFLGDMTIGNSDRLIKRLNGQIFFIRGNHDGTSDPDSMHDEIYHTYKGTEFLFVHDPADADKEFDGWVISSHNHNSNTTGFPFFDPEKKRINVSVELIRYKPCLLDTIVGLIESNHGKIETL